MTRILGAAGLAVFAIASAFGQAGVQPAFEVASVKPSSAGGGVRGSCHGTDSIYGPNAGAPPPLGRCAITDARLGHLINIAFDLRSMALIKGAPSWVTIGDDRYTIEAKAEQSGKATEEQLLGMLQALLMERFQLKFHRQAVETSGFALVAGKNGPKMTPTKSEEAVTKFKGVDKPMPGQPIALVTRNYSMARLATTLSMFGTPLIDKTGLSGGYDFELSWDETNGPALSTALQEQLGLRLESQKVPISLFIVDSAQKPTGN